MIELGRKQTLTVVREKEFGVYVCEPGFEDVAVLLPRKQVPENTKIGDALEVFIYKDSEDRLIATTATPKLEVGQCAVLEVQEVNKVGAFLNMGMEKDLLLPYREQSYPVKKGDQVLVALYIDKSNRLAATMHVYPYLQADSPYQKEDHVRGHIYEIKPQFGAFVAVDDRYYGLIPRREFFPECEIGTLVEARVLSVREDGKLDLSLREKAYVQMNTDAQRLLEMIEAYDGIFPYTDKTSPEVIKKQLKLSKNAFKRAVGHLLKEKKISMTDKGIELLG
ncbi:MAG: S1-like domain-containing RNA-binding protein [bacterium]|nr:S1-like domain-containing RNA-binding protein [bacterium]